MLTITQALSHIRSRVNMDGTRSASAGADAASDLDAMEMDAADMVLEPTQRRSEVAGLGLFGRAKTR
jgi:hypothetical protein